MTDYDAPLADVSHLDALVSSGDCFVTLATQLDELTHIGLGSRVDLTLEQVVSTLMYLQRNYQLGKKPADYRQ